MSHIWNKAERRIATLDNVNLANDHLEERAGPPRERMPERTAASWKLLIVSRGLAHAEPWAVPYSE